MEILSSWINNERFSMECIASIYIWSYRDRHREREIGWIEWNRTTGLNVIWVLANMGEHLDKSGAVFCIPKIPIDCKRKCIEIPNKTRKIVMWIEDTKNRCLPTSLLITTIPYMAFCTDDVKHDGQNDNSIEWRGKETKRKGDGTHKKKTTANVHWVNNAIYIQFFHEVFVVKWW